MPRPGGQSYTQVVKLVEEALVFIPTVVPSSVLLGGILFELNVSSKFSASDTVNWLPITQAEYVAASALSVAYNYSVVPAVFLGITLRPPSTSASGGCGWASLFSVSSGSSPEGPCGDNQGGGQQGQLAGDRTGTPKGAFVLRLLFLVVIILVIDTSFNPDVLIDVVNTPLQQPAIVPFIPILWGSIAIDAVASGDALEGRRLLGRHGPVHSGPGLGRGEGALEVLVADGSAPSASPQTEYRPQSGILVRFGLTSSEAAIVRKDLKGVTRRRELISFFAVPIVFVAIFLIDTSRPRA